MQCLRCRIIRNNRTNRSISGNVHFGLFITQILLVLMAAVGGIMTYISFDTLLPLAKEYGNWHLSIVGIMSGILFIWLSLNFIRLIKLHLDEIYLRILISKVFNISIFKKSLQDYRQQSHNKVDFTMNNSTSLYNCTFTYCCSR